MKSDGETVALHLKIPAWVKALIAEAAEEETQEAFDAVYNSIRAPNGIRPVISVRGGFHLPDTGFLDEEAALNRILQRKTPPNGSSSGMNTPKNSPRVVKTVDEMAAEVMAERRKEKAEERRREEEVRLRLEQEEQKEQEHSSLQPILGFPQF